MVMLCMQLQERNKHPTTVSERKGGNIAVHYSEQGHWRSLEVEEQEVSQVLRAKTTCVVWSNLHANVEIGWLRNRARIQGHAD